MKEKDIVNFDEMKKDEKTGELIDSDGEEVGCEICYTHEKAFQKLNNIQFENYGYGKYFENLEDFAPLCPDCGKPLKPGGDDGYAYSVVSEANFSEPEGSIGLYQMWHCDDEECTKDVSQKEYAMVPIHTSWNANHDIHYTGGRHYAENEDIEKLIGEIFEEIKPSIKQYVDRKLNPKDGMDEMLDEDNVMLWCKRDVEAAVCNWLYERGLKK